MDKKRTNNTRFIILALLFLHCECKRTDQSSGRRGGQPTPRTNPRTTHSTNNHHHQSSTQGSIGFEHYQRPQANQQHQNSQHPQNSQHAQNTQTNRPDIGFENVQNRVPPNNHPPNRPPHSSSQAPIGFENVHQRVSPHPGNSQPGTVYHYTNNHHTYYNQHYSPPSGVQLHIYQPVLHSGGGGGSVLGGIATGYLIGRLASGGGGGGGHNYGNTQYTVHHYHYNRNEVPNQISVQANKILECAKDVTQGLCVPNTFPLCLSNGTIICVTHSTYTTSCGGVNNMACIITMLPCVSNGTPCNSTAVYVPCISNVTVSQQIQHNYTTDTLHVSQNLGVTNVQYCVTAIAEPKKLESPVRSYLNFLQQLAMTTYQTAMAAN